MAPATTIYHSAKGIPDDSISRLETIALAECLVELGRPLTNSERRCALTLTKMFSGTIVDLEEMVDTLIRFQAG